MNIARLFLPALIATSVPALAIAPASPDMVPAGDPVRCIQTSQIRDTRVINDQTIDFRMNGNRTFRNTLPNRCPGLGVQQGFAYSPTANQLCSVDTITVIQQAGGPARGATCGLGQFVPMQAAPAAK